MIRFVRRAKSGEFIGMSIPVEVTAIYDTTAYAGSVSVHIFGSGVNNDICSPFERAAVNRSRESIVNNQRDTVAVRDTGKLLNIQHFEGRIGNCFTEQCFRIRTESCGNFFFAGIRIDESNLNTEFFHCHSEQVESTTIDSGRTNEMVTCLANIEDSVEVGSLTAGSQHGGHTTFEGGNLSGHSVIRRVLQAGIEITAVFQIEKTCHLLAGIVFESCTLIDGQYAWFALFRRPPCLYAQGFGLELFCHNVIGF